MYPTKQRKWRQLNTRNGILCVNLHAACTSVTNNFPSFLKKLEALDIWNCYVSFSHREGKSQKMYVQVKSKAFRSYHKFSSLYECNSVYIRHSCQSKLMLKAETWEAPSSAKLWLPLPTAYSTWHLKRSALQSELCWVVSRSWRKQKDEWAPTQTYPLLRRRPFR